MATRVSAESLKPASELVGAPGFEPGAFCSQSRRATKLRYAPRQLECGF